MVEVSTEEFYKKIGSLDVTLTVTGNYPFNFCN